MKTKLDFILTAISPDQPPKPQLASLIKSLPGVGTIVAYGRDKHKIEQDGMEFHATDFQSPRLSELVSSYLARMPNNDLVAIMNPSVIVTHDFSSLFKYIEDSKSNGKAWAFFSSPPSAGAIPELFVTTSYVLEQLKPDIPSDATMTDQGWSLFLDGWFGAHLPLHRYVDVTSMGLVVDRVVPALEPASIASVNDLLEEALNQISPARAWAKAMVEPEPTTLVEEREMVIEINADPIKKRRGRPRRNA